MRPTRSVSREPSVTSPSGSGEMLSRSTSTRFRTSRYTRSATSWLRPAVRAERWSAIAASAQSSCSDASRNWRMAARGESGASMSVAFRAGVSLSACCAATGAGDAAATATMRKASTRRRRPRPLGRSIIGCIREGKVTLLTG
jgi:hypothetical protein